MAEREDPFQKKPEKRSSWNGLELGKDKIYAYMRSQRSPEVVVKSSLSKQ